MARRPDLSRRQFLRAALTGGSLLATPAILAACGTGQPASQSPTEAQSAPTAVPATAPAPTTAPATVAPTTAAAAVELTHWDWWNTQGPAIDEEIRLFQAANPGITIKKTTYDTNQYSDLFGLAIQGKTVPDVFLLPQKPSFEEQVASGVLANLSQFPDFAAFRDSYSDPELNFVEGANVVDGKAYTAPWNSPSGAMWNQLWLNTKVFKDAGLVDASGAVLIPKTLDEMLDFARTIKEKSGGSVYGYGVGLSSWAVSMTYHLAQLSGGDADRGGLNYKTGTYSYSTTPAYQRALEAIVAMRDEGLIIPDSASVDDEAIRVLFAQHRFGMMINGTWVINGWKESNPDFKEFTLAPVPLIDTDAPISYYYSQPGERQFGLSATSQHPEAAWKWFQWIHSPEAAERWVKAGNGLRAHPAANKPEYADNDAMREFFAISRDYVRVGPQPALRNPAASKVQLPSVKPDESEIVRAIFTGQITDIAQALKDLDAAKQAALETAVADAQAAGAEVSLDDFRFADWDPTKDYSLAKA